jgi:hypothetical protein
MRAAQGPKAPSPSFSSGPMFSNRAAMHEAHPRIPAAVRPLGERERERFPGGDLELHVEVRSTRIPSRSAGRPTCRSLTISRKSSRWYLQFLSRHLAGHLALQSSRSQLLDQLSGEAQLGCIFLIGRLGEHGLADRTLGRSDTLLMHGAPCSRACLLSSPSSILYETNSDGTQV